ncbi:MAG: arginine--tRNA ligase, partial [Chitinophagaceae bacterium]
KVAEGLEKLYGKTFSGNDFQINQTKPEFKGDYTVILFSLVKMLGKSPDQLGSDLGGYLMNSHSGYFTGFNIIKGFLNLEIHEDFWTGFLTENFDDTTYGYAQPNGRSVMVEYSSPNTNKPLHLGHLRNNFLGWSVSEILKANGFKVIKTCVVNDRGIHICKSMLAWQKYANGANPESTHIKGDHLVGDYYVKFNDKYKEQVDLLVTGGLPKEEAEKEAPLMKEAQIMLLKWENGDPETIALWKKMNGWVYTGFEETYKRIGSDFEKTYYESQLYLLGKKIVEEGLGKDVFAKRADGSVWIDLTADGLDEKLLLRKDGTSVYMTQDIGLAKTKYQDFQADQSIYVVGDEQNYHLKVLKLICQKMHEPYADSIVHLSYGMVELTTGKMKSREGTVVDADDLIDEMVSEAETKTLESGKAKDFTADDLTTLYNIIGIGAMKFYLLRVDPKKRMIFNPIESIDLHGFTATAVQYTHARIKSILRTESPTSDPIIGTLLPAEKELLVMLEKFPVVIAQSGEELNPSQIALFVYDVAKKFNSFYDAHSILKAESEEKKSLRLKIASLTANTISNAMQLLGIAVPERM